MFKKTSFMGYLGGLSKLIAQISKEKVGDGRYLLLLHRIKKVSDLSEITVLETN